MKIKLLLGAGALVAAASVGVLVMLRDTGEAPARPPQDGAAVAEVSRVRSASGLVEKYGQWAGKGDKLDARLKIIDALLANEDGQRALKLLADALALDPTPLADDPLLDSIARKLERLWENEALFQYGRDFALVQNDDKVRVVLVQSLVTHELEVAKDPDGQRRAWLTQDVTDVYFRSGEPARERLVAQLERLGAHDAVKVIQGSPAAALDVVQHRVRETETTVIDLRTRGSDPTLKDLKSELRQIDDVDRSKIEDGLTRPY